MDIFSSIADYIFNLPVIRDWMEIRDILERAASARPRDWQLPMIACQAMGGSEERAIPACAAIACAQIGIILVDDMLDEDPRGEYRRIGAGNASNFAIAFQAAGTESILLSGGQPEVRLEALKSLNDMLLITAYGQYLDVSNPSDEKSYWRVVENKSAPFYGAALHVGALLSEVSNDVAEGLRRFGRLYGEMIQIHDDLNDTMAVPANPDWTQGRSPLPILFAQSVDHPERQKFLDLRQNISNPDVLREAQNILIRCGAVSYCIDQVLCRYRAAQAVLVNLKLAHPGRLGAVLEEVIAPVGRLLEASGRGLPELFTDAVRDWERTE